ncbi:hypothetical protein ACVGOW_34030 [Pseudonocardia saturnea]
MNIGVLVGGSFGLVYVLVNSGALGAPAGPVLQVAGVLAFVALVVAVLRNRGTGPAGPPRFARRYWIVVVTEVVAIVAGAQVLNALGLPPLPWVTIVVGVHFLPLARMWNAPSLGRVGAALVLCGVAGLVAAVAAASPAVVALLAGVLAGAVLLGGSLWGATRWRPDGPVRGKGGSGPLFRARARQRSRRITTHFDVGVFDSSATESSGISGLVSG